MGCGAVAGAPVARKTAALYVCCPMQGICRTPACAAGGRENCASTQPLAHQLNTSAVYCQIRMTKLICTLAKFADVECGHMRNNGHPHDFIISTSDGCEGRVPLLPAPLGTAPPSHLCHPSTKFDQNSDAAKTSACGSKIVTLVTKRPHAKRRRGYQVWTWGVPTEYTCSATCPESSCHECNVPWLSRQNSFDESRSRDEATQASRELHFQWSIYSAKNRQ